MTDAAASATALLSGFKTNRGVLGVTAKVKKGQSNCETVQNNTVTSFFDLAHQKGFDSNKSFKVFHYGFEMQFTY